ncbi:PREDICTED: G-type lectin S-receptor-like serine/threonine-protein kinase LECRK1 [Nelumbo nucifera]|uniref:Receptor-like serine/threonine-protein kinase n=2 Tax=Nelumbo nucifera TaxID=4432 RepID=A0A822XYV6_NELNU|nr:PREDICTED: G-type lectin S-receptor-like serine/threonine-protein kinase LECRK1 [Nelumbo nucifera]DAD22578.1 TPA_asm: hypothetical protein HUJ06_024041 [Nelumbo nucifera]
MAAVLLFFLISVFSSLAAAQQRSSNISLGSSLSPTKTPSWLSPSGRFAFGFYPYGDSFAVGIWFAGIPQKTVIWTANRQDPPVPGNTTLVLQNDGRLILQSAQNQTIKSIAEGPQSASFASMLDSGNFVLYTSSGVVVWQSFDNPTDTLLPGQPLKVGSELFSSVSEIDHSRGRFRLKMQDDGNLVQYPVDTPDTAPYSYWASGTNGQGNNVSLNFDSDGHLYLLNGTSFNIRNVTNGGFATGKTMVYRMTIDVDGLFRLYSTNLNGNSSDWSMVWNSTSNFCDPKGLCGMNAYCILMDQKSDCRCLPGFDFIDRNQRTWGCTWKLSAENTCGSENQNIDYSMISLDQTTWEDDPYAILSPITSEEDCKNACLEDCNCDVAVFNKQDCRKQKLPLRYGRRNLGDSTMVYVKVGSGSEINGTTISHQNKKEQRKDILIIGVVFFVCAFILLAFSVVISYRNRVWAYKRILDPGSIGLTEEIALRSFTIAELQKLTEGFKEEVGRGAFGTVFKGTLPNGHIQRIVAVKRLEKMLDEGEREFQTEIRVIAKTHHRNLVRLVGYCNDGPNKLLVYEYMSNGSLADLLFTKERRPNWDERVGIALKIARGILYLHDECETQIIHCDIKPQNILMDEFNCPKIADFGLAKLLKPDQSGTFTAIRGTRGYVAPEWHRNMPITVKADIYSFGVVLLELVCCRRSVDVNVPEDEIVLTDWVYDCFKAGELQKLVGDEVVDKKRLERMVSVGLWCIQDEPSLRPFMKKVVLMLEGTVDIPVPPSPSSFFSTI